MPPRFKGNRAVAKARENARVLLANVNDPESDGWETDYSIDVDLDEEGKIVKYPSGQNNANTPAQRVLDDKQRALVAHFDTLSESMKAVALVFTRRLAGTEARVSRLLKKRPRADMERCRDIVRGLEPRDEDWTDEDERALRAEWERDPLREELGKIDVSKQRDILPLWKIFVRFLSCFPTTIISPRNHLRYEGSFETEDGRLLESPNWTKSFCRRLANLVLHGVFEAKPSLVALALIYVAVCRADYRGPIVWGNNTTDGFPDLLLQGMRDQDGSKSVVEIHSEVLARLRTQGKTPASFMSTLFRRIEEIAFSENEGDPFRPEEMPVFEITTADLAALTRAADSVKPLASWAFLPVSVASRIAKAAKKEHGEPKTLEHLNELREAVILNDRRLDIIDSRRRPLPPGGDEGASDEEISGGGGAGTTPDQDPRPHQSEPEEDPEPFIDDSEPEYEPEPEPESEPEPQPQPQPEPEPAAQPKQPEPESGAGPSRPVREPREQSGPPQKRLRLQQTSDEPAGTTKQEMHKVRNRYGDRILPPRSDTEKTPTRLAEPEPKPIYIPPPFLGSALLRSKETRTVVVGGDEGQEGDRVGQFLEFADAVVPTSFLPYPKGDEDIDEDE